ncbi:fibronectin type III domain-containing protein, partial [Patescibacteria group bacterium]|nr:fibronectin type III domain-containing protein [Patescibacteria group bacterium]
NTLFVTAEDLAGNVNYNVYASVDFYASTPAPGIPQNVAVTDGSNRALKDYKVFLTWNAPTTTGTGFAGYEIYRSTDGVNFTSVGTTTATTYADTNLQSVSYQYYVKAKDNANQYSAASTTLTITPTGKYTSPPVLTQTPGAVSKAYSLDVSWQTDRESSSFIDYGTSKSAIGKENGGQTTGSLEQNKNHSVTVSGLQAGTLYYWRAIWVDSDGNQGQSDIMSSQTGPAPLVSQLTSSNITLTSFLVTWQTNTPANCSILYGSSTAYGGSTAETAGLYATGHSLNLTGLNDSIHYHFRTNCTDQDGDLFSSDDYLQTTLTKPVISNLRFETVPDAATSSLRFTWTTNVPTTSVVTYQNGKAAPQSQALAAYTTDHTVTVSNLADRSTYILTAEGVDKYGNTATSDQNRFTTPNDTRPPKISNLTVAVKSVGFGSVQKAQVVVTWETDEPGTSQLEYGPGIASTDYPQKTREDMTYTTSHVVIASDLDPSKIYHLRAVSRDQAGNTGDSEDTTVITGQTQQSVIDIIMNSLQNSLGWMFNLFGSH